MTKITEKALEMIKKSSKSKEWKIAILKKYKDAIGKSKMNTLDQVFDEIAIDDFICSLY